MQFGCTRISKVAKKLITRQRKGERRLCLDIESCINQLSEDIKASEDGLCPIEKLFGA
jgi:hypothetical protein